MAVVKYFELLHSRLVLLTYFHFLFYTSFRKTATIRPVHSNWMNLSDPYLRCNVTYGYLSPTSHLRRRTGPISFLSGSVFSSCGIRTRLCTTCWTRMRIHPVYLIFLMHTWNPFLPALHFIQAVLSGSVYCDLLHCGINMLRCLD